MKMHSPKPQRCAIYTRKSTEHNLDLAFNSLDAQREACEAYIKSQAHEGWRLVSGRFDDGGLSGASLERPALQMLLDLVRGQRVDIIVVYKVDRLTRSLADFAKLVELFDEHNVSFVSVTQAFNTTSSMGRLTLNVLLSFAQFEREVIGERVRDKIAASKRKGIWVGGPVPLGYRSENKKLQVVPEEAESVRTIFHRYLVVKSVGALVADLASTGITSRGGRRFGVGALAHLLRNRFYIGEVSYRGEIYPGSQDPIIDRSEFEAVQACLDAQAIVRKGRLARSSALLVGLLYDDHGNRLTPSHANKRGLRYRYYVSQAVLQNRKADAGSVARVAAYELESAVLSATRAHVGIDYTFSDRKFILSHVRSVVVNATRLLIEVYMDGSNMPDQQSNDRETYEAIVAETDGLDPIERGDDQSMAERPVQTLAIPWSPSKSQRFKSLHTDGQQGLSETARGQLTLAIAKARRWMRDVALDIQTFDDIARREGCSERHVRFLAPLAFLSPKIIQAIDDGHPPARLTISSLARSLPYDWATQEARFLQ